MLRIVLIISVLCVSFGSVKSQPNVSTYPLKVSGDFKKTPDFNTENITIEATVLEQNSQVKIGLEVIGSDNVYKLYVFDEVSLEETSKSTWTNSFNIYKWAKDIVPSLGLGKGKVSFDFDGTFINYDREFLKRSRWEEEQGYKCLDPKISDFDSYTIINTVTLPETTIEYVFLVTEEGKASENVLLGITSPIKITIGKPKEQATVAKSENKVEQEPQKVTEKTVEPVQQIRKEKTVTPTTEPKVQEQDLGLKWDNYIKNDLLKHFLEQGVLSYEEISEDNILNLDYEQGDYDRKIRTALKNLDKELAEEKYNLKRAELGAILNSFVKKEIEITQPEEPSKVTNEQTTPTQIEKETRSETTETKAKTAVRSEQNKVTRRKQAPSNDNCIDSLIYYYRNALKLSTKLSVTNTNNIDLSNYRTTFQHDSIKFRGFANICNHPSTGRYVQEFQKVANVISSKLYPANSNQSEITTSSENNKDYSNDEFQEISDNKVQGSKGVRFILIFIIVALFAVMFVFVFKGKK